MREIDDCTVALTVTSPPYWNSINYTKAARSRRENYRDRSYAQGFTDYRSYLSWMQRIGGEIWRVTQPGGHCALVLGTILDHGQHYNLPADVTTRMTDLGWEFAEEITWYKCCAGVRRAGLMIQHPYPGYFHNNILTEKIVVLRRPGPRIFEGRTKAERRASAVPIDDLFCREIANDVWHIPPVPPKLLAHPCPFPEEIPYRLILLYSYPSDLVLDVFTGSGQTCKVARALKRRFVGYEVVPAYAELARRRAREPLHLRENQLVAKFEKIALGEVA
jgi:site-specific DNA-methyltransferase (adenine-specific)